MFKRNQGQTKARRIASRKLAIEPMEARQLMAADISLLSNGILEVEGTGLDDVINIEFTTIQPVFAQFQLASNLSGRFQIPAQLPRQFSVPGVEVTVRDTQGNLRLGADGNELREVFPSVDVNMVHVDAGSGNDVVKNHTDKPSLIQGQAGNDTIQGGSSADEIDGGSGADQLSRGAGDDVISAGSGNDRVYAGSGDDLVEGESGNDQLFGGNGDDVIFGGTGADYLAGSNGNDMLHGDAGNDSLLGGVGDDDLYGGSGRDELMGSFGDDGLFGGGGEDTMNGGSGDDRFLVLENEPSELNFLSVNLAGGIDNSPIALREVSNSRLRVPDVAFVEFLGGPTNDVLEDLDDNDARINFENGAGGRFDFSGGAWSEFAAGSFSDAEIELVDQALGHMHRKTGNTALLKKASGEEILFQRFGAQIDGNFNAAGINSPNVITFVDATFDDDEDWVSQVVYHEIGHNFDSENPDWEGWKDLSDWRQFASGADTTGYTQSTDGQWWFENGAQFSRNYGKRNPKEDFATSFAKYFMDEAGRDYSGAGEQYVASKMDFLDDFFASLA
jgi:hypothetical protein